MTRKDFSIEAVLINMYIYKARVFYVRTEKGKQFGHVNVLEYTFPVSMRPWISLQHGCMHGTRQSKT